jgi:hypothetical protein
LRDTTLLFAVMAGPELRFVAASQAVTRAVGRALVGRTLREALPEYESIGLIKAAERVYSSGEAVVAHAVRVPLVLDGVSTFGYRDLILQALRDDEGVINAVVYFGIDVTEQVGRG